MPLKVLDLFAGAGGLSEGFIRAGCEMVGHIEMDKNACETLITRMVYHALLKKGKIDEYKKYVLGEITRDELIKKYKLEKERDSVIHSTIGADNYKDLIADVKEKLGNKKLDLIVGGPPCQAYSHIGRARDKNKMASDDRNFLYKFYVEFLKELQPKIFVFENVPGLKTAAGGKHLADMRALMLEAGYETELSVLNTVDFGVPQNRKRIILIGWSKESKMKSYPDFAKLKMVRSYTVSDVFSNLPKLKADDGELYVKDFQQGESVPSQLLINDFDILMSHVTRPNNEQDLEIYKQVAVAKKKGVELKYNELPKELKTHKNEHGFLDRFKVVDPKAQGSHTVVAHIGKDGHHYIHPDVKQNRSISVREAARLQTFPDSYKFEGARTAQFKQIGNAVPPLFSTMIAKELIKYI